MLGIKVISVILWVVAILGAGLGGLTFIEGLTRTQSAPQEASLSGMALVMAILPYCVARGFDEIFKKDKF